MPNTTKPRLRERVQTMERKKLVLACTIVLGLVVLTLATVTIAVINTQQRPPTTSDIVVRGKVTCLPRKDTRGPQTMECALGLRTDDNRYYALQNTPGQLPANGTAIEVHGTLASPEIASIYDIVNTISVTSFTRY